MNRNALPYLKNTHTATVPRSVIGVGFVPKPGTMRALPRVRPSGDIYRRMYAPGNEWITECDVLTHDYHSYGLESTKIAMQASRTKQPMQQWQGPYSRIYERYSSHRTEWVTNRW
jgi:hypothetical protein